jgi:hypothetical protein
VALCPQPQESAVVLSVDEKPHIQGASADRDRRRI